MNTGPTRRRARLLLIALLVSICGLGWYAHLPATTFAADGGDPGWDAAVEQSQAGRPAVLLFTADWCPVCQSLRRDVLSRPDVAGDLRRRHTFVVVDMTHPTAADRDRAARYGITNLPTMIRFDRRGRESARTFYQPADALLDWLAEDEADVTE